MLFKKSKVETLAGKTEVQFTLEVPEGDPEFKIIASASGVRFKGESPDFWGQEGAQKLAETIGQAFTEYQKMRPRFATTVSGH